MLQSTYVACMGSALRPPVHTVLRPPVHTVCAVSRITGPANRMTQAARTSVQNPVRLLRRSLESRLRHARALASSTNS